jgi:molybdopterin-containing oxidoreductase family membrane subunit
VEIGIFVGTLGIFFTFFLIFVRIAPVVAIAEIKHILKSSGDQYANTNAKTAFQQIESGSMELEAAGHGSSHEHGSH